MKPLRSADITGTWGAVLLPLNADDSIDYGALAEQVEALLDAGLAGLYTNGTAGEFHTQTEEEFDRISVLVAERCARRGRPFQLGVCHMSAQLSRERLRRAKLLAPGAVQVILPDWVPVSPDEARAFLTTMAELADPVGLVLYTPGHAKRSLDPAAVGRLRADVPRLIGVKTPDGDASWYEAMRRNLPGFSVFVPGHHLATGHREGATGSYSNVACLSPRGAQIWYELMERDPSAALAFEGRLRAFFQAQVAPLAALGICPAAIDKALAAAGGWGGVGPRLRWPYRSVDAEEVARLAQAARRDLPELWRGR
ncbi:dihydrodipicolinate synthase family protein [Termitidicoccus mucosus]|uniref:Dihydrodipicolinate synthase family protein n=1 Tax=Termitidicoccus mucosus TaxID=1184151 RepID=A0A178IP50_9BACT|nr:dihydrodipicolinate synthase family protein [Opitutaceae bacterium TSB47]